MGFTHDPGPLPFVTIRDAKWANRLTGHDLCLIEIHGEHGCTMPSRMVKVLACVPYTGECPAHLPQYKGKRLVEVHLEPA